MTKTFTPVESHALQTPPDLPVMMPLAHLKIEHLFGILNLGHWDLFEIWFLVLGIFIS